MEKFQEENIGWLVMNVTHAPRIQKENANKNANADSHIQILTLLLLLFWCKQKSYECNRDKTVVAMHMKNSFPILHLLPLLSLPLWSYFGFPIHRILSSVMQRHFQFFISRSRLENMRT